MAKKRLDVLLVERELVDSRSLAQRLIMAGQVRVAGQLALKPAVKVEEDVVVTIDFGPRFVSRGGEKLQAALDQFPIDLQDRVCADVGASTGGFTDCMLQAGASRVYAVDVGHGILDWKLRQDQRVVVMEKTNARYLEALPEPVTFVSVDVAFISLKVLLPVFSRWYPEQGGEAVLLIKPQFEAGRKEASRRKGVIREPEIHRRVLEEVLLAAVQQGFGVRGLLPSPLLGAKGNREFLAWLDYPSVDSIQDLQALIEAAVPDG